MIPAQSFGVTGITPMIENLYKAIPSNPILMPTKANLGSKRLISLCSYGVKVWLTLVIALIGLEMNCIVIMIVKMEIPEPDIQNIINY